MTDNKIELILEAITKGFPELNAKIEGIKGQVRETQAVTDKLKSSFGELKNIIIALASGAGVQKIASTMIDYNKTVETSKLGIAAILTSMGEITDAQGHVLSGQEKFNAAQKIAVQAQQELQKIAMTTPATYQELVSAYQGILAPAMSAKLTFKETLELTGLMTNSVKAIGLPIQQIVQESRDLVMGTIDQNSQLARSLGITNDQVKKWREQGTVLQEVKTRLEGFVYASNEFENNWEGAWSNFKDIAQRSLGEGFHPVFEALKREVKLLADSLVNITRDEKGKIIDIQIKPEIKQKLQEISLTIMKLIDFIKDCARVGGVLIETIAKPALFALIAVKLRGIGDAILHIGQQSLKASAMMKGTIIGAMIEGGLWLGAKGYETHKAAGFADEVLKEYGKLGGNTAGLEGIQHTDVTRLIEEHPELYGNAPKVAGLIRGGVVRITVAPEVPTLGMLQWDKEAVKKYLNTPEEDRNTLTGKKQPLNESQRKDAQQAIQADLKKHREIIEVEETKIVEAYKTAQVRIKEQWEKGDIDQKEYMDRDEALQQAILEKGIEYNEKKIALVDASWRKEKGFISDKGENAKREGEIEKEKLTFQKEIEKQKEQLTRTGIEGNIKALEYVKELERATREASSRRWRRRQRGRRNFSRSTWNEEISPRGMRPARNSRSTRLSSRRRSRTWKQTCGRRRTIPSGKRLPTRSRSWRTRSVMPLTKRQGCGKRNGRRRTETARPWRMKSGSAWPCSIWRKRNRPCQGRTLQQGGWRRTRDSLPLTGKAGRMPRTPRQSSTTPGS